jgi:hypothetical protein
MEPNKNMEFWDSVKKTDPARVKAITGKQYKGNSPQPYYMVQRCTEAFGMCGTGWGFDIVNERMERLTESDVLHIAVVKFWYKKDGEIGTITHIGQTKACYRTSKGELLVDEDAPKKSVTDALTKCMSHLGFAGDIFSGQWDDSKYVAQIGQEFAEAERLKNIVYMNGAQVKELQDLITETGTDINRVYASFTVPGNPPITALKDIPAEAFEAAKKRLLAAKSKIDAKKEGAEAK